ncbi:MAG: ATP-binding protein [Thermoleophilia bacterium]
MKKRTYWHNLIESAWEQSSLLWLSGVRQTGKTVLGLSLDDIEYFNCEVPRIRREVEEVRGFLAGVSGKRVVIDEIHRLRQPAELLHLAATEFPDTRVLVTGPASLKAYADSYPDIESSIREIWLTPMMSAGLTDFGNNDVVHRLQAGGLPNFFMSDDLSEAEYQKWMDVFWARDVQSRVRVSKHWSFQRFMELLFENSGGIFEALSYAKPCDISHPTVASYLRILEEALVVHLVRPFTTQRPTEIVSAPRVYAFDTGFVCYYRGWGQLGEEDLADLWRHFILNEIQSRNQLRDVRYWRDKSGHNVDFILVDQAQPPVAVQCAWSPEQLDLRSLKAFRYQYPDGENWVVCREVSDACEDEGVDLNLRFVGLNELAGILDTRRQVA